MAQVRLKGMQIEPFPAPFNGTFLLPRSAPERSLLRPQLIASLQGQLIASLRRLLTAPLLVRVKPTLPAALTTLLKAPLLVPLPGSQLRPLLASEHAPFRPLHFAPQPAALLRPPASGPAARTDHHRHDSTPRLYKAGLRSLARNPRRPSLCFKKTGEVWAVRVGNSYRVGASPW
jgi:hypothetical protein